MSLSNHMKPWTQAELNFLAQNYPVKKTKWLAEHMGRTHRSIVEQAKLHGIRKITKDNRRKSK